EVAAVAQRAPHRALTRQHRAGATVAGADGAGWSPHSNARGSRADHTYCGPQGRTSYCLLPMTGPSPIREYPAGDTPPLLSAKALAAAASALTDVMFAGLELFGTTTVSVAKPVPPAVSVA